MGAIVAAAGGCEQCAAEDTGRRRHHSAGAEAPPLPWRSASPSARRVRSAIGILLSVSVRYFAGVYPLPFMQAT